MSAFARRNQPAQSSDFMAPDQGPLTGGNPLAAMGLQSMYGNAALAARPGAFPFQSQLEGIFGQDLSGLDVSIGGAANTALAGLNAAGASAGGKILLPSNPSFEQVTHEVAHGLQDEKFGSPTTGVSTGTERAEVEADRAVDLASQGKPVELNAAPSAAVHRWGLGDLWEDTKSVVGGAASTVADVGSAAWNGGGEILSNAASTVSSAVSLPFDVAGDVASGVWNTGGQLLNTAMDPNKSVGEKLWSGAGQVVGGVWNTAGNVLSDAGGVVGNAYSTVQSAVHTGADIGTSLVGGLADNVLPAVADIISGGGGVLGDLVQTGGNFLGDVVSGGAGLLGDVVSGGAGLLGDVVGGAGGLLSDGVDFVSGLASEGIGGAVGLGQDLLGGIAGLDTGIPFIDDLVDGATGGLSDLLGAGGGLMQDLVEGGGSLLSLGIDTFSGWTSGALSGLGDLLDSGITGLGGLLGDGIGGLSDLLGSGLREGSALLGEGLGSVANMLSGASQSVRDFFGLDNKPNDFTGYIEMRPSGDGFTEQYSELGIPLTSDAWGFQDQVDGGKLHDMYDRSMLGSLQNSGVLDDLVSQGVLQPDQVPSDFSQLNSTQLRELTSVVQANTGNAEQFLNSLSREDRTNFQQTILHNYMEMARNDTNAAFIFEMLPTETGGTGADMADSAFDAAVQGQGPNNFAVGEAVGKARVSDVNLAQHYQQQGRNTYGLVVPYANTPSNVVGRTGTPTDGSDNLQNYLNMLVDPVTGQRNITTVAAGYSQGGAAVLDYVDRYGDTGLLDNAVAIAPMGGTDRHGGTGVNNGNWNGVNTLAVMNEQDPAQHIHGDNLLSLLPGMVNFSATNLPGMAGEGDRHGTYWGAPGATDYTLPDGADRTAAFSAGTFGYPTQYIQPMITDMLNGEYNNYEYGNRGAWDYDLNEELVNKDAQGRPIDYQLRGDPRAIADRYHPGK